MDDNESLLALTHYLDCAQLTQQCQSMLMSVSIKDKEELLALCWWWLPYTARYTLDKVKAAYIAMIAADKGMLKGMSTKREAEVGQRISGEEAAAQRKRQQPCSDNIKQQSRSKQSKIAENGQYAYTISLCFRYVREQRNCGRLQL